MSDRVPDLPENQTIVKPNGTEITVHETVDEVQVSAGRKVQLDQYEPADHHTTFTATKPEGLDDQTYNEWLDALTEMAWAASERGLMRRLEEQVPEDFVDD